MLIVGRKVRVLPPFDESFPDEYEITEIVTTEDNQQVYIMGDLPAFDAMYLQEVS